MADEIAPGERRATAFCYWCSTETDHESDDCEQYIEPVRRRKTKPLCRHGMLREQCSTCHVAAALGDLPCCEDGPPGHTRQQHHDASPCYDQACLLEHPCGGPFPHPCDNRRLAVSGTELIAAERQRQIDEEGWSPAHDAAHTGDDLSLAAASYALPDYARDRYEDQNVPYHWPWEARFWKPTPDDRVRELIKAGALIAAEIDRLQGAS